MYKVKINASTFAIPLAMELNTLRGSMIEENVPIVSSPDCMPSIAEAVFWKISVKSLMPAVAL